MRRSLLVLLGLLELSKSNVVTGQKQPCSARAWVRAPDLEAGQVIQGEVKVKLDGTCDDVSSYSLRLRFAERSYVKTWRVGVKLPELPREVNMRVVQQYSNATTTCECDDIATQGRSAYSTDPSTWEKFERDMKDPKLWLKREEERIGFEIKYDICAGKEVKNDVVEPFALLVPTTVYPPAFEPPVSQTGRDPFGVSTVFADANHGGSEHIYAYFVDIAFVNGTTREVSAGYTSFNGGSKLITQGPETVFVTPTGILDPWGRDTLYEAPPEDNFTLEVTFPNGRYPEQGSINNITVVSHQLGPGLGRPERLERIQLYHEHKHHWVASHAADNATAEGLLYNMLRRQRQSSQRRPTGRDTPSSIWPNVPNQEWSFPQEGIVENGKPFSTNPITAQFEVPDNCYPYMEMQHKTSEVTLMMILMVRNTSLPEESTCDDQEDYDWTPTLIGKDLPRYTTLYARIPIFVRSRSENSFGSATTSEGAHYLSPEALAPVFVPPSSVNPLLRKSPAERDTLAPKARPTFVTYTGADIVQQRYHQLGSSALHYVGNTWLRKAVLPKEYRGADVQTGGLVNQA